MGNIREVAVIALVVLASGLVCGSITRAVNTGKGYRGGFAWGLFLGVIGVAIVAMRPAKAALEDAKPADRGRGWECICGAKNSAARAYCRKCGRRRPEESAG